MGQTIQTKSKGKAYENYEINDDKTYVPWQEHKMLKHHEHKMTAVADWSVISQFKMRNYLVKQGIALICSWIEVVLEMWNCFFTKSSPCCFCFAQPLNQVYIPYVYCMYMYICILDCAIFLSNMAQSHTKYRKGLVKPHRCWWICSVLRKWECWLCMTS